MTRLARRWLLLTACVVLSTALITGGCRDEDAVRESDLQEFQALLDNGLTYREDPYVRAETLRVLETLRAPQFRDRAERRVEDGDPMVRVAAIRALLAMEDSKADGYAVSEFSDATARGKRGILEAVLEYSSESQKRDLLWRAVESREPAGVRRYAFETGLIPRVEAAMEGGNESFVRKLFLPNVNRYVEELDVEIGGLILRLMLRYGETERAEAVVDEFSDSSNAIEDRLNAARILVEAGAETAKPAYERILERADVEPNHGELRVPEQRIDKRLVQAAVLGMVSAGDEAFVTDAKAYMKDASTDQYVETLTALSHNPKEDARLALETALRDARPTVRHTAVELYSRRDDADLGLLLNVHAGERFKRGTAETRYTIARALARQPVEEWIDALEQRLNSDAGMLPALRLLENVHGHSDSPTAIDEVRDDLLRIATSERSDAAPHAAYLLMQLPDDRQSDEIHRAVRQIRAPRARYAFLADRLRESPGEHTDFLIDNLYADGDTPELYSIRLMAGAGLWRSKNPPQNPAPSESEDNPEVAAQ